MLPTAKPSLSGPRWDQAEMNTFAPGNTEASSLTSWPSLALPEPEEKGHCMHRSPLLEWGEISNYRMWKEVRN